MHGRVEVQKCYEVLSLSLSLAGLLICPINLDLRIPTSLRDKKTVEDPPSNEASENDSSVASALRMPQNWQVVKSCQMEGVRDSHQNRPKNARNMHFTAST